MGTLKNNQNGTIIITLLVLTFVFVIFSGAIAYAAVTQYKMSNYLKNKEQAKQIAEAGINYYYWHLISNPTDYKDGNSGTCNPCGPYQHNHQIPGTSIIGQYSLMIYPPTVSGDPVLIESTGWLNNMPSATKKITATIGKTPYCSSQLICNNNLSIDSTFTSHGKIHANGGVKFDGVAYNIVQSARQTYLDPLSNLTKDGVWTSQLNENNVFLTGKIFPVMPVDFSLISNHLQNLKTASQANGKYLATSAGVGYYILLKNNDTYDLYTVNTLKEDCVSGELNIAKWAPLSKTLIANYAFPANGIIFAEDDIYLEGQINTAKLTIVAAKLPEISGQYKNIIINNDLIYTNKNGADSIGLISQKNVIIGLESADTLDIDAAIISEYGNLIRENYPSSCDASNYQRTALNLYGSLTENIQHVFKYSGSGYTNFNFYYDNFLGASPPPSFPTTGELSILNWTM